MPASQRSDFDMVQRDEPQLSASAASPRLETRLPQRRMVDRENLGEQDNDGLDKRSRERMCGSGCSDCCPDDPDEDTEESTGDKGKKNKSKKTNKKTKKQNKKSLYKAIRKRRIAPYVRFVVHESMNLPGSYDPRQLDINHCGENLFDNNWIQWHSEKVAMALSQGARIKCQTFTLRDVRKNTASVGVFDPSSKIVWDSNPFEGRYTPRLITDGNFTSPSQYRRYEFDCKKYDHLDTDSGVYYYGWKCRIISRDQTGRKRCLEPLGFDSYGGQNIKGNVTTVPCHTEEEDEDSDDYGLMYWDIESVASDFESPEMMAVNISTPIKDVPKVPREVPYYGY